MPNRTPVIVALVGLALVAFILSPGASPAGAPLPTKDPTLDGRLAAVERKLHAVSSDVDALTEGQDEIGESVESIIAATPVTTTPAEADAAPIEVIAQRLEARTDQEPRDAAWASTAESTVRGKLLDGSLPGLSLGAVSCRSSLCRVELRTGQGPSRDDIMQRLPLASPWPGSGVTAPDPDGDPDVTVLYLAREGTGFDS